MVVRVYLPLLARVEGAPGIVPVPVETMQEILAASARFQRYDGMGQDDLGIWASPSGARVAWLSDPEGNTLSLTQFKRPSRKKPNGTRNQRRK